MDLVVMALAAQRLSRLCGVLFILILLVAIGFSWLVSSMNQGAEIIKNEEISSRHKPRECQYGAYDWAIHYRSYGWNASDGACKPQLTY